MAKSRFEGKGNKFHILMESMKKSYCKGWEELPGPTLPTICHICYLNKPVCQVVVEEGKFIKSSHLKYKLV